MTQFQRLARGAALAAAALCAFAGALGCWSSAGEAKKSPAPQQGAQQGSQPAPASQNDEASQQAAAAAAARKAYDAGLKEFANGRLQAAADQLSTAVKAGGLSPPEMAKALYTRGVAYKKLNRPGLAISDLTSALWLKNGLNGNDRDAATRERTEAYRMAGLEDNGGVPNRPVVAPANSGPSADSAGLSPKAIAEAASSAGKSGPAPVAQPITRQDATSEAAQDAARARTAYASDDSSLQSIASSSVGTGKANAPVVQSATVGPSAWSTSAQPSAVPATAFAPLANTPPAPVKVSGTFTLLKPALDASTKAQASTKTAAAPSVVAMNEAKAPAVPPPAPVVWAQPSVQPAPAPPAPAAAPAAKELPKLAAVQSSPAPAPAWTPPAVQSSRAPVSTWTPPPEPAPAAAVAVATAPKAAVAQPPPAAASIWTPPASPASASVVAPSPTPAAEPEQEANKPEVSVPMTTAGYVSSLFASDLPTPPPPRRVSFSSEDSMDSGSSAWSDSKGTSAGNGAKVADKKSKAGVKSIMVADNKAAPATKAAKYKVHIAALRSRAEAEALAQKLVTSYAADLSSHIPTVDEAVIGSMGRFYRVRITGYNSQDEPRELCNKLRTGGLDCLVVTN